MIDTALGWNDVQRNPLLNTMFLKPETMFLKAVNKKYFRHSGKYITEILRKDAERVGLSRGIVFKPDNKQHKISFGSNNRGRISSFKYIWLHFSWVKPFDTGYHNF